MGKAQSYSGTPLRNVPEWEMGGHGAAAALRAARKTHGHGHFAAAFGSFRSKAFAETNAGSYVGCRPKRA